MIPASINPLFGTATNPGAARQTSTSGAQAFGEVLSRELDTRQQDSSAQSAPRPALPAANPDIGAAQVARQNLQRQQASSNQASLEARQDAQHSQQAQTTQRNQDAQRSQEARRSQQSTRDAQADAAAPAAQGEAAPASAPAADGGPGTRTHAKSTATDDAADSSTGNGTAAGTSASGDGAGVAGSAAAALQALVHSLLPKAGATGTADTAAAAGTGTATVKLASAQVGAGADSAADAATEKSDPAFDALLAQAAQLTKARAGDKAALDGALAPSTPALAPSLQPATAGSATAAGGAAAALAATLLAKTEGDPAAENLAATLAKDAEPATLSGVPGVGTAIGAAAGGIVEAAAQPGSNLLSPHVGTTAWENALGQKVVWMAAGAEQTASLTLNPPDLGPLQVVINVSNSHAEATFTAAQPEVRQALEAAMPRLKEMMADAGISLGQTSVNAGSPNQHGGAQQHAQSNGQSRRAGTRDDGGGDIVAVSRARTPAASRGNGLVDTFV